MAHEWIIVITCNGDAMRVVPFGKVWALIPAIDGVWEQDKFPSRKSAMEFISSLPLWLQGECVVTYIGA